MKKISEFSVVELIIDFQKDIPEGTTGTILEIYDNPLGYLVEFSGDDGCPIGDEMVYGFTHDELFQISELIWQPPISYKDYL